MLFSLVIVLNLQRAEGSTQGTGSSYTKFRILPAEALSAELHSSDIILNILARRRDASAAISILAPEALRLHHEPTADCARYDSLRRAV